MLEPGTQIGKYRILSKIGAGGMADVYQGEDTVMGRQVALKVLPPEFARDPERIARFEKEVRHLAALDHPGIVTIYDVGRENGCHFYAMALLPGGDLKARIRRSIPPEEALAILSQTAEALGFAHANQLIHRDIKPENIMFDRQDRPVLTDLGIAKAIGAGTRMTATGMSIGTPHYMSPEQARGQAVDHRSDLYSLGVVFYEMLTGHVPYDAEDSIAIGIKHVTEAPPRLSSELARFQPLLDRLLAKNPDDRYRNAGELVHSVAQLRNGKPLSVPASGTRVMPAAPEPSPPKSSASGWKWGVVGVAAALAIAAGVFYFQGRAGRQAASGGGSAAPAVATVTAPAPAGKPTQQAPSPADSGVVSTAPVQPAASGAPDVARVLEGREAAPAGSAMAVHTAPDAEARATEETAREQAAENARPAAAEASRQAEIRRLLSAAESDMAANRLISPVGRNATARYRSVLTLDEKNSEAMTGLSEIVSRYLALCEEALADENFAAAEDYLSSAAMVIPDAPEITAARERIATARNAAAERARMAAAEAAAEAARQEEIQRLLSAAETDLAANRLTTPADSNAAERYRAVLALDRSNREAAEGLSRVVGRYLELSDKALNGGSYARAKTYLDRAAAVAADVPEATDAREGVKKRQREKYDDYMATATSALDRKDRRNAVQYFKAALALYPLDAEAAAGLKQAEKLKAQPRSFTNSLGMRFVYIPPGTFMMGSPPGEEGRDDDETRHRVTLTKGYWMQTTEVTVGQWRRFARETGYRTEAETGGGAYLWDGKEWKKKAGTDWAHPGFDQTDRHPVTCISWNDVQRFVRWMNEQGDTIRYRLPSEAEWEYACRAGTTWARYWGNAASKACGYANVADRAAKRKYSGGTFHDCDDGVVETAPVGRYRPNAWGLHDMIGNVWEWCSDWYGGYPSGAMSNPVGAGSGKYRVYRGGGWCNKPRDCRSAIRDGSAPGLRSYDLGFRLSGSP